jgi:prophage antirepressor-like protein
MKELIIFNYEEKQVRTVKINGETWFVLKDVCDILEIERGSRVSERLDEDEVRQTPVTDNLGRKQETTIINEAGLYNVILRSDKPEAKKFKRWITHEVLPSIRNHGAYLTPDKIEEVLLTPDTIIQLATALKEEQAKNRALAVENETLEIALNASLQFFTVAKYNNTYKMGWNMRECQTIGKELSAYCRANSIEIKRCETNDERFGAVNSYPATAFESFLYQELKSFTQFSVAVLV